MTNAQPQTKTSLACIVLAAGKGTRMHSDLAKVLHPVASVPMIRHVIAACAALLPERIVTVVSPQGEAVQKAVAPNRCVVQKEQRGTGDAVRAAEGELKGFAGDIIVLFGDTPLISVKALEALRQKRDETQAAIVVAGFTTEAPGSYGRLVVDAAGKLTAIVEANDATLEQRAITLCNGGVMLFEAAKLWPLLAKLRDDNAKKEFYLTDCVRLARAEGLDCAVSPMSAEDVLGINTRVELAEAETVMQRRLRRTAMLGGATLIDPETVYLAADTVIGRDVTIGPNVVMGSGVTIADRVEIKAFCHLEQVRVDAGAIIGPFARLRPGSSVGEGAHIGNFVEIKNTEVGKGAKINHLAYIGDATIGAKANIGAGTITCNYDGFRKSRTHVGAETFIGSNTALVAPVNVGDGAYVGAGSVITQDVPANTLAVARSRQANIEDWATRYRDQKSRGGKDKD